MVEVPSVLLQIEEFAELVDFFSVGSKRPNAIFTGVDRPIHGLPMSIHISTLRFYVRSPA